MRRGILLNGRSYTFNGEISKMGVTKVKYSQIGGNTLTAGVKVPLLMNAWKYLDWRQVKGTKAAMLTSPYGEGHFVIGGDGVDQVVLDYAELPDGNFMVDMKAPDMFGFHCEDAYNVFERDDVMGAVHHKLTKIVDRMEQLVHQA